MKRYCSAFLLALVLAAMLAAQDGPLAYEMVVVKGESIAATFDGRTFDEAWPAALKALVVLKYKIAASEKDGGTISAERQPTDLQKTFRALGARGRQDMARWEAIVEAVEGGVCITLVPENIISPKRAARHVFDKVAELMAAK